MGLDYEYLFNLIMVGDMKVGKTALLLRFTDERFSETHLPTIGVDFKIKTIKTAEDGNVRLQLWDTAGQDRFKTIVASFYRLADGLSVVFDVTCAKTFENVRQWFSEADHYDDRKRICSRVLIGNKCDLNERRVVSREAAEALARELGVVYIETSAKDTTNVSETFMSMSEAILKVKRERLDSLTGHTHSGTLNVNTGNTQSETGSSMYCCA